MDSDYARVLAHLSKARLTPYVAYRAQDSMRGVGSDQKAARIVVRVSDGTIVSGTSSINVETDDYSNKRVNPVTNPVFDASCYRATSESSASYNGAAALKFTLAPTCKSRHRDEYPFTTLYADPGTYAPLEAVGASSGDGNVSVAFAERFGTFDGRTMPATMHVDISGSGLMFWLQIHVAERYSDYRFMSSPNA